ncbi:MAG: iron-containing alcohol dehydrogenase [Betaproteobacteria bacterium]|nr:MAG: iron-containing alcohol dehydrogenase [Betaproteobacteria bacterium]
MYTCCRYYGLEGLADHAGDTSFSVEVNHFTFGPGCLREAGSHARALGMRRIALYTDKLVRDLPYVATVKRSLEAAGCSVEIYWECEVEPTDRSFKAAAQFAIDGQFDGFVSVGGGSVIDTAKAANLLATYPADLMAYVNAPIGEGRAVPGALKPHIACPTTCGTGSEVTGIAIFDLLSHQCKTGILSRHMLPSRALVDPDVTHTLSPAIIAANGFDALSHALESYTARAHSAKAKSYDGLDGAKRPMNQGANLWSDMGARESLRVIGQNLVRAVNDPSDQQAKGAIMYSALIAGMTFSNAGCHLPHGMSYAVSGLVRDFKPPQGYPQDQPMVPHGMSVVLNAPSVYRFTGEAAPERHLEAAQFLGAEMRGANTNDAGEIVAAKLIEMMRAVNFPNGLNAVGYTDADAEQLAERAFPQQRVIKNAPRDVSKATLAALFKGAMRYW